VRGGTTVDWREGKGHIGDERGGRLNILGSGGTRNFGTGRKIAFPQELNGDAREKTGGMAHKVPSKSKHSIILKTFTTGRSGLDSRFRRRRSGRVREKIKKKIGGEKRVANREGE